MNTLIESGRNNLTDMSLDTDMSNPYEMSIKFIFEISRCFHFISLLSINNSSDICRPFAQEFL
jgi:hypothetical protein